MGAIGGLLGTAGGQSGTGVAGPGQSTVLAPIDQAQVQQANTGSQNSLASQQQLLAALQSQGGLGAQQTGLSANQQLANQLGANNGAANQAKVYGQGQELSGQLQQANGIGTQGAAIQGLQGVAAQQQGTADMYRNIANGTGPNPAQAALNQSTGQNVANQAALMAGQRGASSNVGLLARQAAQQGANTQQQAVGQSATLQANQQIAGLQGMAGAQNAMGQTHQMIGGLGTSQLSAQQAQQNMLAGQAQNQVGNQMGANQAYANQANIMGGQQIAQTNAGVGAAQNQQNMGMQALGNYNTNLVNSQGSVNSANAGLAGVQMKGQQDLIGGVMQGVGLGAAMAGGGYVAMADGGAPYAAPSGSGPVMLEPPPPAAPMAGPAPVTAPPPGPQSAFGQFLAGNSSTGQFLTQTQTPDTTAALAPTNVGNSGDSALKKGGQSAGSGAMQMASKVAPLLLSTGGSAQHDYRGGGHVKATTPAEKAVKPGNSYANDKIKALLSEGEVVIPKTVMESKDPVKASADFVAKVLAKRKVK